MKRERRRRERARCAIDGAGMNHCLFELAKLQAGDREVDTLIYCGLANTLKNRPERGDLADEDDALEIAELLEIRESPVYLFKNRCSAAPADANLHCTTNCKGLEQHSSQPVKVSD